MKRFLSVLIVVMMFCTLTPALCSAAMFRCKKCGIEGMADWSGKVRPKPGIVLPKQKQCEHEFVRDDTIGK